MARTPFDLTFAELAEAGAQASARAVTAARDAGVPIATFDGPPPQVSLAGWTDARVESLVSLWRDGLSSSQIAQRLGGVTPNAVQKKIQRLGLSGRALRNSSSRAIFRAPRRVTSTSAEGRRQGVVTARYVEAAPGTATVLTLGAHMCKWPIGDPRLDNYTFCGRRSEENSPYCHDHSLLAQQPTANVTPPVAKAVRRYAGGGAVAEEAPAKPRKTGKVIALEPRRPKGA